MSSIPHSRPLEQESRRSSQQPLATRKSGMLLQQQQRSLSKSSRRDAQHHAVCSIQRSRLPHAAVQQVSSKHRQRDGLVVARATLDDPELAPLLQQMESMRPDPPAKRENLTKCLKMIDELNSKDPSQVTWEGERVPYRLLYSSWVTEWVRRLDPKASDELIILARGRQVESWRLSEIKRDDYAPNMAGMRQWEGDRKRWLAGRLAGLMRDAGYGDASVRLVEEVMLDRDVPDPRDIRQHDLVAPLGTINYVLLEQASMVQTLKDADALVFMEKNFPQMFARLKADEVLEALQKELSRISNRCMATILRMQWTPVQRKLIAKAFPAPKRYGAILKEIEGVAAASSHPGDWRYRNFDYE